jgi:hypothetical protein
MLPRGTWINSTNNYKIVDDVLYANLRKADGTYNLSYIHLNPNFSFGNKNGHFIIESSLISESENDVTENDVTENDVIETDIRETYVTENDIIETDITENNYLISEINNNQYLDNEDDCFAKDLLIDPSIDQEYPKGSWRNSCKNYKIIDNTLYADLKTNYNTYISTYINIDYGFSYGNDNGIFFIEDYSIDYNDNYPKGTWLGSSTNQRIFENILYANLRKKDGTYNPTHIEIQHGFEYGNDDGNFTVETYPENIFPLGSWINKSVNYKIKNNILTAELRDDFGNFVEKQIDTKVGFSYGTENGEFTIEKYENTMFIILYNFLENCLRTITSSIIISEYYNLNLILDVKKSYLRESEYIIIKSLFPQLFYFENFNYEYNILDYSSNVVYEKYCETNYNLICEGRFNLLNKENFGFDSTIYNIIPGDMTNEIFIKKKIEIYKSLIIPEFLINDINNFMKENDLINSIGIHLVYIDRLHNDTKIKMSTSINDYFKRINFFTDHKFLISSDNIYILEKIKKKYPDNFIFINQCSNIMYQTLYEMILLSKTKLIIGTSSSAFSYESAFIKGTDIELFENNEWKLYELSKYSV